MVATLESRLRTDLGWIGEIETPKA